MIIPVAHPMDSSINRSFDVQGDDLAIFPENSTLENRSRIKCIFFTEFDNSAGPRMLFEVPEGKFSRTNLFDKIASFIIPVPELTFHQLTITAGNWRVLGYPVLIENSKYERNAMIFNLCFVFQCHEDLCPYETIVRKLGEYLRTVEIETGYISSGEYKKSFPQIMSKLLADLNNHGKCSIEINQSNRLFLKVVGADNIWSSPVHEHDVPVVVTEARNRDAMADDLTTRQIVPLIDGTRNIHQISEEVDADGDLVRTCIQNMIYYGIAKVVPSFSPSNIYRSTPNIRKIILDPVLQKDCIKFIQRDSSNPPNYREIMTLFGDMQHGTTVSNWLSRHPTIAQKVDEKKLCDFGVMNGLIRRVHKCPVYIRYNQVHSRSQSALRYFNGAMNMDEIRVKMEADHHHPVPSVGALVHLHAQDPDDVIETNPNVYVCWK